MPLTNAGRNEIANLLVAGGDTPFNNANAYIGAGDDSTAFSVTHTDLNPVVSGNKYRTGMDATYPTIATNVLTFRATFGTGVANFAWQEWGVFNASVAGTMLNRKVESLGTKTSSQTWQFTATLTVTTS